MKDFLKIVKENVESKTFEADCIITLKINVKNTDITNAGEDVVSELDNIESELCDLGYCVTKTQLEEIKEVTITESVEKEVLNNTPDEELEKNVVDIFNVVESRLKKIDENVREKALNLLKDKLNK